MASSREPPLEVSGAWAAGSRLAERAAGWMWTVAAARRRRLSSPRPHWLPSQSGSPHAAAACGRARRAQAARCQEGPGSRYPRDLSGSFPGSPHHPRQDPGAR
ncbi:MAG: hypothetical protein ACLQU5_29890, partial [Isosphaeraceae bacterium]